MDKKQFLDKLRSFIADPQGKIWDDVELYSFLDEALKQYSIDSGAFVGSFDFFPDKNGVYHFPEDFGHFMIGWNNNSQEIFQSCSTARKVAFAPVTGQVKYIYDDLVSHGDFSVKPLPADNQNLCDITITPDMGEIFDSEYGVFEDDDYGTTLHVDIFDSAGTVFYSKIGNYEDVKDYMAIIAFALYLASCADSEFVDPARGEFWKNIYKSRLAVWGRVKHNNSGRQRAGNFF